MPLIKSGSDAAFHSNVAEMIKAGHPRDQALAAAYRIKRGYAEGGTVDDAYASELEGLMSQPRPEWGLGDWEAMGASVADPMGVPSAAVKTVAPQTGQAWQDLESAHPDASFAGSMLAPGITLPAKGLGLAAKAAAAYPKTAMALGGLGLAALPAEAGDQPSGRPQFTEEDSKRLDQLQRDITSLTKQKQNAINQVGKSRIGAVAQSYDDQIGAKQHEIENMRGGMQQRQADYDLAGQPLAIRNPDAVNALRAGGLGLGALTGLVRGGKGMGMLGTAIGGGAEGLAGVLGPTMIDLTKPRDTDAYKTAHANLTDPDYWEKVAAPDTGYGALLGAVGHEVGHAITAPIKRPGTSKSLVVPNSSPIIPTPPPASPAPVAEIAPPRGGKSWPSNPKDINMFKGADGNWRERGTGHFIPKNLQPTEDRARGGTVDRAFGGVAPPMNAPWYEKAEARNLMHSGPILSSVPGRTDHLPLTVASGSYVLPSTHVASMGQGNTLGGFNALNKMFGGSGPYGVGKNMSIPKMGAPKAPALPKFRSGGASDTGGGRGDGQGQPVDIMAAGGEYVIPPEVVKRIGNGNLKHGHDILDHWVLRRRKQEITTQRKLPPPAKR